MVWGWFSGEPTGAGLTFSVAHVWAMSDGPKIHQARPKPTALGRTALGYKYRGIGLS